MTDTAPIFVDGATGYIGSHLVARLRAQGLDTRAFVHPGSRDKDLDFLRQEGCAISQGNLEVGDSSLAQALSGCHTAIHLVGSIAPKKGESLSDLHGKKTRALVQEAKLAGVRKLIMVSALGSKSDAASSYHSTKWGAEEAIATSGIAYVILQPSLVIGRRVGNRNSKLVTRYMELITSRPRVPLVGGGANKIQPVFVEDVVAALMACLDTSAHDGKRLEIAGPQVMTMKEFVGQLMQSMNMKKGFLPIPAQAASLLAGGLELLQSVPLLSRDQVILATADNIARDNALESQFKIKPATVKAALATYAGSELAAAAR